MKKLLPTLSLLLAGVLAVSAQTWTTFNHPRKEFSVDLPARDLQGEYAKNGSNAISEYKQVYNGTYFLIFSYSKVKDSPYHYVQELAEKNNAAKREFNIGKYKGERFDFKDDEEFYQSIVTFQGKKHFHIFHVLARSKDDPYAAKFFNSIKLKAAQPVKEDLLNAGSSGPVVKEAASEPPDAGGGTGGEIGGGIGDGSGVVFGGGPGPIMGGGISSQTTGPNASVWILSKPRPSYTEIARRYGLSGTVRLRVTFLSDGKIGAVAPINWLPFGLTNNAITAARQVKFTPAAKNNVPVTVSKIIEYNFILY